MATIAPEDFETRPLSRLPVSRHPAFPAIVALWFAALLGFGSLVLPGRLVEAIVESTGVSSLLPAAAPPLGFTARTLIAVVFGAVGAALGIAIARRIAGMHANKADALLPYAEAGDAAAEIGVPDGSDGEFPAASPMAPATRRRALAITDLERSGIAAPIIEWREEQEPDQGQALIEKPESTTEGRQDAETPHGEDETEAGPEILSAPEPDHAERDRMPLENLGLLQLVQRLGSTMEKRREWLASSSRLNGPSQPAAATFVAAPAEEAAQATAAYFDAIPPAESPLPPVEDLPPAQPPAHLRPAFLDWFDNESGDEDDESPLPELSIPLRVVPGATLSYEPEDEESEAEPDASIEDEDIYGSLIGMKNPFATPRSDFIRIEEPEAELEPGQDLAEEPETSEERPYIDDTDAALRAALANLQRMSGAA